MNWAFRHQTQQASRDKLHRSSMGVVIKVRRVNGRRLSFQNHITSSHTVLLTQELREICTACRNDPILTSSGWARKGQPQGSGFTQLYTDIKAVFTLTSSQTTHMYHNTNFSTCIFTKPSQLTPNQTEWLRVSQGKKKNKSTQSEVVKFY